MNRFGLALSLLAACTQHIDLGAADAGPDAGAAPDTLTVNGRFCTPPKRSAIGSCQMLGSVLSSTSAHHLAGLMFWFRRSRLELVRVEAGARMVGTATPPMGGMCNTPCARFRGTPSHRPHRAARRGCRRPRSCEDFLLRPSA